MFSLRSIKYIDIYIYTVYLSVDDTIQTESAPPTPVNRTQSRNGNLNSFFFNLLKGKFIFITSYINLCILQGWMDPDHYEDNGVHLKAISPDKVLSPCRRHPRCPQADDQPVPSSNRRARWQAITRSRWILWTTGHLLGHRLVDRRTREVSRDDDTASWTTLLGVIQGVRDTNIRFPPLLNEVNLTQMYSKCSIQVYFF